MITSDLPPAVRSLEITCAAVPLQVEGELLNGWRFYFRCRGQLVELGLGETEHDAVMSTINSPYRSGGRYACRVLPGRWDASLLDSDDEDGTASRLVRDLLDEVLAWPERDQPER